VLSVEHWTVAAATRTWRPVECSSRIVDAPHRTGLVVSLHNENHNVEESRVYKSSCDVGKLRDCIGQAVDWLASQNTGADTQNLPLYVSSCINNTHFWTWSASCASLERLALVEEPLAP
jgi:hypothetical protein